MKQNVFLTISNVCGQFILDVQTQRTSWERGRGRPGTGTDTQWGPVQEERIC